MKLYRHMAAAAVCIFALTATSAAQSARTVFLSGSEGCTDCISLSRDSKDMDVIVKFAFDETANTISVSLISYRGLFVFFDNVRYSKVFKWGSFKPGALPYEVTSDGKCKYSSSAALRRSIGPHCRSYVFRSFFETDGLQMVPSECRMVGDRIDRTFNVLDGRAVVSLTLHDIMLMDPQKKEGRYRFVFDRDVSCRYDIALMRDPCHGKEKEIEEAAASLETITAAYDSLLVSSRSSLAKTAAGAAIFADMKALVLKQFQKKSVDQGCDCLKESAEKYNAKLDQIEALTVVVPSSTVVKKEAPKGINADRMLSRARKIDLSVSRWLVSSDPVERKDIEKSCRSNIAAAKEEIRTQGVYTQAQKNARDAFLSAEAYFNRTCR